MDASGRFVVALSLAPVLAVVHAGHMLSIAGPRSAGRRLDAAGDLDPLAGAGRVYESAVEWFQKSISSESPPIRG